MVSTAGIAVSVLPEHRFSNPELCETVLGIFKIRLEGINLSILDKNRELLLIKCKGSQSLYVVKKESPIK